MTHEELIQQALALPLPERVALAHELWRSIDERSEIVAGDEREAIDLARSRDAELATGAVVGRTHAQVMEAARRALECD